MTVMAATPSLLEALQRVEEHANKEWLTVATRCVHWHCTSAAEWDGDDFWEAMTKHYPEVNTHEHRALGPLIRWATTVGWLEPIGFRKSRLEWRHQRPIAIYRSLIVRQP